MSTSAVVPAPVLRAPLVVAAALVVALALPSGAFAAVSPERGPAPNFDVARIIDKVRFAFRDEAGGWVGVSSTYEVRHEGGGLEVTPRDPSVGGARGGAVRFGATTLERGGVALSATGAEADRGADGQLEVRHEEGIVERLRNGPAGLEQSWEFAATPAGEGDLVVRVPVTQGEYLAVTEGGLHLGAGNLGVRYGHATWIDAAGDRWPIEARWNAGTIELRVPSSVVDASAFPAVLDPIISPETAVDAPVYGPPRGWTPSAVAAGSSGFLVVFSVGTQVVGARVSPSGQLLDPFGFGIFSGNWEVESPAAAFDGANYLVAWSDMSEYPTRTIVGARVSEGGVVLDPGVLSISPGAPYSPCRNPSLDWDGASYLVVWRQDTNYPNYGDIYGARVSASGTVLDPGAIAIAVGSLDQTSPSVSWNGTSHLVVWNSRVFGTASGDVFGARVSAAGQLLDASGFAISAGPQREFVSSGAISWDGTHHLVVWSDNRSGAGYQVFGARVDPAGQVLDPVGIEVSTAGYDPAVAWDGTNHLVAWSEARNGVDRDVYLARVGASGAVIDPNGFPIAAATGNQVRPVLARGGASTLAVWSDDRPGAAHATRIDATGAILDPTGLPLPVGANTQDAPSVAWNGTNFFVAWHDSRSAAAGDRGGDVYGVRVSATGAVLDPAAIRISTSGWNTYGVKVAWGAGIYLVAWDDYRSGGLGDVYAARVTADGNVLDSGAIPVATRPGDEAPNTVTWDGGNFLVLFNEDGAGRAARVSPAGTVIDATPIQFPAFANAAVWDGTNHFVVWSEGRASTSWRWQIYGARVSPAGVLLDPQGVQLTVGAWDHASPLVSWDGTGYLLVWADFRSNATGIGGGRRAALYGGRVSDARQPLDGEGFPIFSAQADPSGYQLSWDGVNHFLAWSDNRAGATTATYGVYGARVSPAGVVLDPDGAFLSSGSGLALSVQSPLCRYLLVTAANDATSHVWAARVRVRTLAFNTPPVADPQSIVAVRDSPVAVLLTGSDPDGDPLTFRIATPPAHGALSGTPPNVTYAAARHYDGPDAFTFVTNDGSADSKPATVSVTVSKH